MTQFIFESQRNVFFVQNYCSTKYASRPWISFPNTSRYVSSYSLPIYHYIILLLIKIPERINKKLVVKVFKVVLNFILNFFFRFKTIFLNHTIFFNVTYFFLAYIHIHTQHNTTQHVHKNACNLC